MAPAVKPTSSNGQNSAIGRRGQLTREQLADPLCEVAVPESGNYSGPGEVITRGEIAQMQLPDGWTLQRHKNYGETPDSYWQFQPPGNPDAMIMLYERGKPLSKSADAGLQSILEKPPHVLTKAEIKSIAEVLDDQISANDFRMTSAYTKDLHGKTILVIEGRYLELKQDRYHLYVRIPDSAMVQEIFYQAPAKIYPSYLSEAEASFDSITWR
jgi:hypothetical protein